MWCAQTINPRKAIETIAALIPIFPKICFLANVTITWEAIPKPGIIRI